ncbi:Homeobox-like domain superfamily [Arabidopsis thaliana x Arabidopsis arenosa]|uniref:Homeobox-like domain superfamily n=1 Tax=Arabidopsis thaliana x Arabidopsis arenosa TaxID=1240361 RepID=A0A8T1YDM2_9BRAS|nr:Homeobox-like domain superfamily [Arabidopsis thaliana x Arabidopsis arenosa]
MYHQNLISSTPNQNSDPHNCDIQNRLFSRHPSIETPSKNPFMGITSFPNTNVFEGFQYNITNDLKFPMTYNTQFPVISEGISYNMHDFQENTMRGYTAHNQGLIIGCHEPVHVVVESQQFNVSESEGINLISQSEKVTKETFNKRQDKVMFKTDHKKKDIFMKGQWTPTEDEMLVKMVKRNGIKNWTSIAKMFQGRVGKQCRERWHNHLRPDIKKNYWSEEEDQILIEVHKIIGNKWTEIARRLPGRSENIVKNHWNATKRRLHTVRAKKSDALPPRNNALENYIRSITINNGLMNREVDSITANSEIVTTKCENIVDEVMNLNLDATRCFYVPEQASLTWMIHGCS